MPMTISIGGYVSSFNLGLIIKQISRSCVFKFLGIYILDLVVSIATDAEGARTRETAWFEPTIQM